MPYALGGYEFLVYVVPGGFLLFFFMIMLPSLRPLFGGEPMNVVGLVLILVVAFILGQLLQTVAFCVVEKPMIGLGFSHRTNSVIWQKQGLLSKDQRDRLINAVERDFQFAREKFGFREEKDLTDETLRAQLSEEWRQLVRRIHARVNLTKSSDRLEIYLQHYAVNMGLVLAFFLIGAVLLTVQFIRHDADSGRILGLRVIKLPRFMPIVITLGVFLAMIIALMRMSYFDRLFAEELFGSYLQAPAPTGNQIRVY